MRTWLGLFGNVAPEIRAPSLPVDFAVLRTAETAVNDDNAKVATWFRFGMAKMSF